MPGDIAGFGRERVIYAPADGLFEHQLDIGAVVNADDVVGRVGQAPVPAPIADVLRGLVHDGVPDRSVTIAETTNKGIFGGRKLFVGRGHYMRSPSAPDPETGATDPFCTLAWAGVLAEVEVDTETGEVDLKRLVAVYDVGKSINPTLTEGQIHGGAGMAIGAALMEQHYGFYPSMDYRPATLGEYIIPTTMDVPDVEAGIYECPSPEGSFGAKGIGEMTANVPPPAIIKAIHDAIGVWITENPVTPERILRALAEKQA